MESGKHYIEKRRLLAPATLWVGSYSFGSIKQSQEEVDTLLSFHFREERLWRHDPKKVVKEHCSKYKHLWEYTLATWEEEEVHCGAQTYDEVIAKRQGKSLGRIVDEEKSHEEDWKRDEEEATKNNKKMMNRL
jgi:hypothetical protein